MVALLAAGLLLGLPPHAPSASHDGKYDGGDHSECASLHTLADRARAPVSPRIGVSAASGYRNGSIAAMTPGSPLT